MPRSELRTILFLKSHTFKFASYVLPVFEKTQRQPCSIISLNFFDSSFFSSHWSMHGAGWQRSLNLHSTPNLTLALRHFCCCSSLLCETDLMSQHLEAVSTQALSPQVPPPHTPREGIKIFQFSKKFSDPKCSSHCSGPKLLFRCKFILFHLYLLFRPCGSVRCQMEITGSLFEGCLIRLFSFGIYSINIY